MYILRDLEEQISQHFQSNQPEALILAGIVGAGKTTLIEHMLGGLSKQFQIFQYSGDDSSFRSQVEQASTTLFDLVSSTTSQRALIFVDEVQKTEFVLDALKLAFDKGKYSFIVSGSNPAFLDTIAKKRLQRRAEYLTLSAFSLPEILFAKKAITQNLFLDTIKFTDFLFNNPLHLTKNLPSLSLDKVITNCRDNFMVWGGLPLVHFASTDFEKLRELRRVVERGFEPMISNSEQYADTTRVELARLHSKEFAYQGLFQKTGVRRRETVNQVIDDLVNHGYLIGRKPLVLEGDRRSYLTVYSYVDPGIVTYLKGGILTQVDIGSQVEGYVHSRLTLLTQRSPHKSEIYYYKPYKIGSDNKLKFSPGEIDFILKCGDVSVPIEAKSSSVRGNIDTALLRSFIVANKLRIGVVLYGGAPYWEKESKILFWPYWLV